MSKPLAPGKFKGRNTGLPNSRSFLLDLHPPPPPLPRCDSSVFHAGHEHESPYRWRALPHVRLHGQVVAYAVTSMYHGPHAIRQLLHEACARPYRAASTWMVPTRAHDGLPPIGAFPPSNLDRCQVSRRYYSGKGNHRKGPSWTEGPPGVPAVGVLDDKVD